MLFHSCLCTHHQLTRHAVPRDLPYAEEGKDVIYPVCMEVLGHGLQPSSPPEKEASLKHQ